MQHFLRQTMLLDGKGGRFFCIRDEIFAITLNKYLYLYNFSMGENEVFIECSVCLRNKYDLKFQHYLYYLLESMK